MILRNQQLLILIHLKIEVLYQKLTGYRQDGGNERIRKEIKALEEALRESLL